MYKRLRFEVRTVAEIEADLRALRLCRPNARSVFLADSDALVHPRLPEILTAVRRTFPEAERIISYARLHTLRQKRPERLAEIRAAGLTRIHAGLESGSRKVLEQVGKGATPECAEEGSRKAIEAGFTLSLYLLSGLGGEADWEEHAGASGRLLAKVAPHFLRLRSLVLLPGTKLHDEQQAGRFRPVTPEIRLREITQLIRQMMGPALPRDIEICSDHFSNYVWADGELVYGGINGYLAQDGAFLIETLETALQIIAGSQQVQDPSSLTLSGRRASLYTPTL